MKITKTFSEEEEMTKTIIEGNVKQTVNVLLKEGRFSDINWLLTKLFNTQQCIEYSIFATKAILEIYEKRSPNDRLLGLISKLKKYLKDPSKEPDIIDYAFNIATKAAEYTVYSAANTAFLATNYEEYAKAFNNYEIVFEANNALKTKIIKYGIDILDN